MSLSAEDRNRILKASLRDIFRISDKEYQRRIWIRGEGPECDDFVEIVCRLFQKAESILEEPKRYGLSDFQLHVFENFIHEFEKFSDVNDLPQLFIDTPEWTKITLMAKKVLEVFNYQN